MIIIVALFLFFTSISLFLSASILMRLTMAILPDMLFKLGSTLLLSTFALLFITGLFLMTKIIYRSAHQYFSSHQRLKRRLLFFRNKRDQLNRQFYFRTAHINYFHEQHKKRLIKANEHKQIRSLSKAIRKDLFAINKNLQATAFIQLYRENNRYRINRDSDALLKLQQKIVDMART